MPLLGVHAEDVWVEADASTRSGLYCDVKHGLLSALQHDSKGCAGFGSLGVGRLIADHDAMHRVAWQPRGRRRDRDVSGWW